MSKRLGKNTDLLKSGQILINTYILCLQDYSNDNIITPEIPTNKILFTKYK